MPSPFPGMNPYLENPTLWSQVHTHLIVAHRQRRISSRSLITLTRYYVPNILCLWNKEFILKIMMIIV